MTTCRHNIILVDDEGDVVCDECGAIIPIAVWNLIRIFYLRSEGRPVD